MLKVEKTLGQRHFPDFSRKENSKSSQIQMFPDFSRKKEKKKEFSRLLRTLYIYISGANLGRFWHRYTDFGDI